jgi:hypothetical protein
LAAGGREESGAFQNASRNVEVAASVPDVRAAATRGLSSVSALIAETDDRLAGWVQTTVGAVEVWLGAPRPEAGGSGVSLYLMELVPAPAPQGGRRPPLQFSARYLVTTWAADAHEAHRLLEELLFAAMDATDLEVDLEPLPGAAWAAFGVAPRPSFLVRVPMRRERPERPVKLVRVPPVVETVPVAALQGVVVGPADVPLAGARVELPALGLATRTDPDGRFRFGSVPAEGPPLLLKVSARGRETSVRAEGGMSRPEGLVIRMTAMEG